MPDALGFPVKRRSMAVLGAFLILIAAAGLVLLVLSSDVISESPALLATPFLGLYGASLILASRNVREIRVTDQHIQFLPVGNILALDEIVTIKSSPAGSVPKRIELVLRSDRRNYVPGALWQWGQACALNVVGCDSNALLATLEERLPTAQAA
ncbi:hypothetical protein [Roseovarius sp.]|uniref:hypothetical protein n=1 Tax=Roseovarius sp. TaxID=1486281 RepID=UPI002580A896|nr:hypothetical protein [Roseovarius sp.]